MEEVLSLHFHFLRNRLHCSLVSLRIRCFIPTNLVIFHNSLVRTIHKGSKQIARVGDWETSTLVHFNDLHCNAIKVTLLHHLLGLRSIFQISKRRRQTVSQYSLGISGSILCGLQHLLRQSSRSKDEITLLGLIRTLLNHPHKAQLLLDQIKNLLNLHPLQVLRIHPLQLIHIKHRRTLHNPINIKRINQLLPRENLIIRPIIPSQQRQIINHGIRQEPIQSELITRRGTMTLTQFLFILTQNQRTVCISWPGGTKCIQDQSLSKCIG
mmetsp:Transcript_29762/g.50738  ORF Transcript_29762/g.50738 Transcript_29762/m.50738 type:complete len:268 (+) Transcript_29762:886-1689(+)